VVAAAAAAALSQVVKKNFTLHSRMLFVESEITDVFVWFSSSRWSLSHDFKWEKSTIVS
jgi:hypothetical protein